MPVFGLTIGKKNVALLSILVFLMYVHTQFTHSVCIAINASQIFKYTDSF